jgi:hypothetical protein
MEITSTYEKCFEDFISKWHASGYANITKSDTLMQAYWKFYHGRPKEKD